LCHIAGAEGKGGALLCNIFGVGLKLLQGSLKGLLHLDVLGVLQKLADDDAHWHEQLGESNGAGLDFVEPDEVVENGVKRRLLKSNCAQLWLAQLGKKRGWGGGMCGIWRARSCVWQCADDAIENLDTS
jgi:hypothetical protein